MNTEGVRWRVVVVVVVVVAATAAAAAREELPGEVAFAAPRGALPLRLPALEAVDEEEEFERPKKALARGALLLLLPFVE